MSHLPFQHDSRRAVWPGLRSRGLALFLLVVCLMTGTWGCQTDQAAQHGINQMRAEQIAVEERYAALRNDYEKLRRRLAAQGDQEAREPGHPSALPLTHPPGPSHLDLYDGHDHHESHFPHSVLEVDPDDGGHRGPAFPGPTTAAPPTELRLDPKGSQVRNDPDSNRQMLHLLVRPVDRNGSPAVQPGTLSLRLLDPTQVGPAAEIGYWHFPAQAVRRFIAAQEQRAPETLRAASGPSSIPLQVSYSRPRGEPTQLLAEIQYHTLGGQRLTCREIVPLDGSSVGSLDSLRQWSEGLPLPPGADGLMSFDAGGYEAQRAGYADDSGMPGIGSGDSGSSGDRRPQWQPRR